MRRSLRIFVLLGVSAILFSIYWLLLNEPVMVGPWGDVREHLFGTDLRWLAFAAAVPLILGLVRMADALVFDVALSRRRRVDAPQLLREIFAILLYFIFFGWMAAVLFRFSLTGFLATGGVLAVVLGFALQDTLGNLFAGISLHLESSFSVGDVIRSGEFIGVVEEIRWRGTRIRTFANNMVTLPNSVLARERLEIFPRGNLNARVITVQADYNVSPAVVIEVLQQAAANVEGVATDPAALSRVGAFGESGVTYEIKYWTRDYSRRDTIDAEIRRAVWYALRRNAIPIPFPIRAVHRYQPPKRDDHQLSRDELVSSLRGIDILPPLPAESLETIAETARVRFYPAGETIIRAGAEGNSMFIIHEGSVSIRAAEDGSTELKEIALLRQGEFFGEMALLTGERRAATAVAVTHVVVIEISKQVLQPVLQNSPELAAAITARVVDRRSHLDAFRHMSHEEHHASILSKIRHYFGIGSHR
jgi:small-conductance mechanosensitive channel/CRP-like cAMP-binding protein